MLEAVEAAISGRDFLLGAAFFDGRT